MIPYIHSIHLLKIFFFDKSIHIMAIPHYYLICKDQNTQNKTIEKDKLVKQIGFLCVLERNMNII